MSHTSQAVKWIQQGPAFGINCATIIVKEKPAKSLPTVSPNLHIQNQVQTNPESVEKAIQKAHMTGRWDKGLPMR